jgi:WD40 repeat protein
MSTSSRTVRVFLSSTFRDFVEERDLLVRKVFPELRRKCRERQVELVDVDLRWGITEEEAQQGKVLPICLAEIDRSRPFFMGFIGERYGWIPEQEKYDLSLIMEQPWLDEHRGGKSVTELEMLHGVLNNPAMEDRAFFYFRDPKWSQKKGGAYLSEGSAEKEKLEALKNRIRQSGFPVVEDYPTPEALAERVKEDLWKLIDEAFPESEVPDALAQERMRHEAFAASRLGLYIGGERYFEALDTAMVEEPCKPVLVCGASGGGKSALLANWAKKIYSAHPEAIVLTHFLGIGADAAHPVNMAIRLMREMARITGEEFVIEGDPRKALRMLGEWFEKAGAFAREKGSFFVLVLDALDKMTEHRDLDWWPRKLPEGVAMVASCLDGDVRDTLARRIEWTQARVSPLEPTDCERFIEDHWAKYRKAVTPEQKALILAHPLCGNPLFLRTLLEELRVFGVHEELDRRLQHYLASETIDDLFEKVLDRIESDNTPESVRAALEVLWAAKESFAEDELLTVSQLPPAVWAPIHIALDESLIGAGGRIAFSHDYLRKAVEDRYLDSEEARQSIQKRMAEFCAQAMAGGRKETSRYVRRHAVEHFLEVEDWDNATAALSDLEFIEAHAIAQELPAMLKDYAEAVKLLPEGEKERQTEAARQAELDRYAKEMYEYSAKWSRIRDGSEEAEPSLPRPVKSVRLWTEEEIATERNRMTETPDRLDVVKAFRVFVATNSSPLNKYSRNEGFVANLAINDAPSGPVHREGKRRLEMLKCIKLIKQFSPNDIFNALPPCCGIFEGHQSTIYSVAFSGDKNFFASVSWDKSVRIWDAQSGECLKVLLGHEEAVSAVAMSADGGRLVSGGEDKSVRIWDTQSGECLKVLLGHEETVSAVAMSADGARLVSGGEDESIRIWDAQSGECLKVLLGHEEAVSAVAMSADAGRLVSGGEDKSVRIWDAQSGECLKILLGHEEAVSAVAMSADGGRLVSGGEDKSVRIWDAQSGECLKVFTGHGNAVLCVDISQDGKWIISGGWDNTLRIWDAESGESTNGLRAHKDRVSALALDGRNKNGLFVSGSWDATACIWEDIDDDSLKILRGHEGNVYCLAVGLYAKTIISGSEDATVRVWNSETGDCLHVLKGHQKSILSLVSAHDGSLIFSGSRDSTIRAWDLESGTCLKTLTVPPRSSSCLAISPDGRRLVASGFEKSLRIWEYESGRLLEIPHRHKNDYYSQNHACAIFSENGKYIYSGGEDGGIHTWDAQTGKLLNDFGIRDNFSAKDNWINTLLESPDGSRVLSLAVDDTLRIWQYDKGICSSVFFLRGIDCLLIHWGKKLLIAGFDDGRVEFFKFEHLNLGPFASTARRNTVSGDVPAGTAITCPPCCRQQSIISSAVSEQIKYWANKAGEGGYTDPALLMDCPSCGAPLRMNPFFVDMRSACT